MNQMKSKTEAQHGERRHRLAPWVPVRDPVELARQKGGIVAFWVLIALVVCGAVMISLHLRRSHPVAGATPGVSRQS